ncbi:MAG: hypothetical protein KIS87_14460 [Phycisphaeraceae bacterium]|nr:hypothetical protein [Phycisphaeraceae bacterium]
MRKICALLALAGTTAIASAQYTMHWYWTGPAVLDNNNPTGTYDLWAKMSGPSVNAYAGSIFDIVLDCPTCEGFLSNGNGNDKLGALSNEDGTQIDGKNIVLVDTFQLPKFFNPGIDLSNPIHVYSVDVTATTFGGTMILSTHKHLNHSIYIDDFGTSVEGQAIIDRMEITCVPTPASLGLIGLGGLVAARRRR